MLGNLAYTLSQFFMLLAVIHFTDTETVGEYALGLAITAPIFIFAGLKMRHVHVTDASGLNRSGEYIAIRLLTSLAALIACAGTGLAISADRRFLTLLMTIAMFKAAEAQVDVLYGLMQRRERLDLVARSMLLRGILGAPVFTVAVALTGSVATAMGVLAALTALFILTDSFVVHRLGSSPRPEFSATRLVRLGWLALPLGLSVSVSSLTTNSPRYFLEAFESTESVGVFATLAYALVALSLIGGSAADAASPRLANLYVAGNAAEFRRLTRNLAAFGLILGLTGILIAILVGEPALALLFGARFGAYNDTLVVLLIAATVQYMALAVGTAVYAMRLFTVQVPINLLGLLVALITGPPLVDRYGLSGAGFTVLATQSVLALCYVLLYTRRVRNGLRRLTSQTALNESP